MVKAERDLARKHLAEVENRFMTWYKMHEQQELDYIWLIKTVKELLDGD